MADKLLFEPKELRKLNVPFTILRKSILNGKTLVKYLKFTEANIMVAYKAICSEHQLATLILLSETQLVKERTKIKSNHKKLGLKTDLDEYLKKHLAKYFYTAFRQIAPVLQYIDTYHKILTQQRRYKNLNCTFTAKPIPELSFKLLRENNDLSLKPFYSLDNQLISEDKVKRFQFLIRYKNKFHFLKRKDWEFLEQMYFVDHFSREDFQKTYQKKLKNYTLDTSEAFKEEVIEINPISIIQVSELVGDLLLFTPRWDYDGVIVEDDKDEFAIYEDAKKIIYKRNKKAEKETLEFLKNAHPKFKANAHFLKFSEASKQNWFFNFYHNQLKDNFRVTGMDMLTYFRYSDEQIKTNFQITKTFENEVHAKLEVRFGDEHVPVKFLQKTVLDEQKFILLKDNSLGVLTEEWLDEYSLILRNSKIIENEIVFAKWILLVNSNSKQQQKNLNMILPKNWMQRWEQWNRPEHNERLYPKSNAVKAELRNYQQKGYEWMNLMAELNAGTLLADDMGLGKTVQTLSSLMYWQEKNPKSRFLIVCPASLIYNWKSEFKKFVPDIPLSVYHGPNRDFTAYLESGNSVLITSYALVRNDVDKFTNIIWDGIVLDESHHIKNYNAQQTRAVLKLHGRRRIILNGTPIMNNISDLFPQFKFLLPQLFHSPKAFKDQYEKPIKRKGQKTKENALKKLTNPFILRRTKETAAPDLPAKTESILWCEMADDQKQAYNDLKKQIKDNIFVKIKDKGLAKSKLGVLQGITKLRQVCSSPHLLEEEFDFHDVSSVKINNLMDELTSNLENEKVLIFSQFLGTMDLLKEAFAKNNISYRSFSGATPAQKRMEMVSEFQKKNSDIQVFLLSLMAGNSGINLSNANYVFLMEPWWNKAIQQQAIDRAHRIGQNNKVFAYNMICKNSIEEKIIKLQNKKQSLSDELITDDNFVKNLDEEDIAFLFE